MLLSDWIILQFLSFALDFPVESDQLVLFRKRRDFVYASIETNSSQRNSVWVDTKGTPEAQQQGAFSSVCNNLQLWTAFGYCKFSLLFHVKHSIILVFNAVDAKMKAFVFNVSTQKSTITTTPARYMSSKLLVNSLSNFDAALGTSS